ncbi:MAG: (2Fe-2S)-binding protein [Deltaproteobacteria bacterium]|nr:(2Fe-2S)-binding protein [Deltaproteobacteria bacterium]
MSTLERHWLVNGVKQTLRFEPLARLLDVLREQLGLLSVKEGCGEGECGTCSVLIDGTPQLACMVAAAQLDDGASLLTAEGLENDALGRAMKQGFDEEAAVQCGYCTPAMLLGGYALLEAVPEAEEDQIRVALAGHICRCTGYGAIVSAVQRAAELTKEGA